MKTKIIPNFFLYLIVAAAMFAASCKKEPLENPLIRLFMPVVQNDPVIQGNQISVSWLKINGAVSYIARISQDSTFQNIVQTITVSLDSSEVVFSNLLWDQSYYIDLQAKAEDPSKDSKFLILTAKTSKFPTILLPSTADDVTDYSIVVRWFNTGAKVTSINVSKTDGSLAKTVTLTDDDNAAAFKEIQGLASSTTYVITIYSDNTLRGTQNYTTIATPNLGSQIIDLRSITGRPTILTDTMATANSGTVFILRRSETYACNQTASFVLSKSIKVICLPGLGTPSQLNYTYENDLSGAIDSVVFANVSISGLKSDGISKVSYMFNTTSALSCNVGNVSLVNCSIKSFGNAVVRLQTGAAPWGIINKILVSNCVINDIGNSSGYALFHAANGGANGNNITNFEMRNSTCYNFTKGVLLNTMANTESVYVEGCTFNDMMPAGYYFMDFNTYTVASLNINNCIFGKTKDPILSRGIRASSGTNVVTNNCYNTSDFFTVSYTIPGLIPYSGLSTDLFSNPGNGDFTIIDSKFDGKNTAGDPRWRP